MSIEHQNSNDSMSFSSSAIPNCLKVGTQSIRRGVSARKSLARFSAESSGTFTPTNNVIRFPISSQGLVSLSEAKLSFDLTNTSAASAIKLDTSAACVIRQMRIVSMDGTELERINNYNVLDNIYGQYLGDLDQDNLLAGGPARQNKFPSFNEVTSGALTAGERIATDPVSGIRMSVTTSLADNTATKSQLKISSTGSNAPYRHEESDQLDTGIARHYEVGLRCSGWFNTAHKRLLPADCPSILEITLAEANGCLVRTSDADPDLNYSVTNPFVTVPVVSIMDATCLQHMRQKMASGLTWSSHTYKHHVNTLGVGTGALETVQINDRSYDLTAMLSTVRPILDISAVDKYSLGKYSVQGITSYQYEIGNQQFPPQSIAINTGAARTAAGTRAITAAGTGFNVSRLFSEVKMVLSRMGQTHVNVSAENFGQSELNSSTGFLAVDCAAYTDMSTNSGIDTKSVSQNVSLQMNTTAILAASQVDTFCLVGIEFARLADGRLTSTY